MAVPPRARAERGSNCARGDSHSIATRRPHEFHIHGFRGDEDRTGCPAKGVFSLLKHRAHGLETALRLAAWLSVALTFIAIVKLLVDTTVGVRFIAGTACAAVIFELFDWTN